MRIGLSLVCALVLGACATEVQPRQARAAPLVASGAEATTHPESNADDATWGASVTRVDRLSNQPRTVKMFGTAGGDPAQNGLYTYIAFFAGAADGWRVFRIGDFLDYRVLADSPGRADIAITLSGDGASSIYGRHARHFIVTWTLGEDGAPPETITVTPAHEGAR